MLWSDGPIRVLAVAVNPGERLLVEEHGQPSFLRLLGADLHEEHVRVAGRVGHAEDRRHLVLAGGYFVVADDHGRAPAL